MNFKIGSFNLYNLVLPDHTYYDDRSYSEADYDKKKTWIQAQVEMMNAQIIGFQEIFHQEALQAALAGSVFSADHLHVPGADGQSPVVGLATTFPVIDPPQSIAAIPGEVMDALFDLPDDFSQFSRPILKAQVALQPDIVLTVLVCHLKSKRPTLLEGEDADDFTVRAIGQTRALLKRAVEASGLRALVLQSLADNDNPLVVIGDLNDGTRSVTNSIIAGPQPWKYAPLPIKKAFWDRALYSCYDIMAQKSFKKEWATHIHNGHYEALDHIYVSQEFYFRNRDRLGNVDFVHLLDDHLQDTTLSKENVPKWQSDHGQVVATLSLK
jgi:predicted extracellular nuclease